jgi:hypothetical protein
MATSNWERKPQKKVTVLGTISEALGLFFTGEAFRFYTAIFAALVAGVVVWVGLEQTLGQFAEVRQLQRVFGGVAGVGLFFATSFLLSPREVKKKGPTSAQKKAQLKSWGGHR